MRILGMKLLKAAMEIIRHIEDDSRLGMVWFGVQVELWAAEADKVTNQVAPRTTRRTTIGKRYRRYEEERWE